MQNNDFGDWTTVEKNTLKKHYPLLGAKVIQLLPNRTPDAIDASSEARNQIWTLPYW